MNTDTTRETEIFQTVSTGWINLVDKQIMFQAYHIVLREL